MKNTIVLFTALFLSFSCIAQQINLDNVANIDNKGDITLITNDNFMTAVQNKFGAKKKLTSAIANRNSSIYKIGKVFVTAHAKKLKLQPDNLEGMKSSYDRNTSGSNNFKSYIAKLNDISYFVTTSKYPDSSRCTQIIAQNKVNSMYAVFTILHQSTEDSFVTSLVRQLVEKLKFKE